MTGSLSFCEAKSHTGQSEVSYDVCFATMDSDYRTRPEFAFPTP